MTAPGTVRASTAACTVAARRAQGGRRRHPAVVTLLAIGWAGAGCGPGPVVHEPGPRCGEPAAAPPAWLPADLELAVTTAAPGWIAPAPIAIVTPAGATWAGDELFDRAHAASIGVAAIVAQIAAHGGGDRFILIVDRRAAWGAVAKTTLAAAQAGFGTATVVFAVGADGARRDCPPAADVIVAGVDVRLSTELGAVEVAAPIDATWAQAAAQLIEQAQAGRPLGQSPT